jgi:uncharacterized protein YjbJ (UPF0337 family)
MFDQYSSGTEAGIEGAEQKAKGLAKKVAGALTHNDALTRSGEELRAEGQALVEESRRDAHDKQARLEAQNDIALHGSEKRAHG